MNKQNIQPLSRLMKTLVKEMYQNLISASEQCGLEKLANPGGEHTGNITTTKLMKSHILGDVKCHIDQTRRKITIARTLRCDEEIRTALDALDIGTEGVQGYLASADYSQALNLLNDTKFDFDIFRRRRK